MSLRYFFYTVRIIICQPSQTTSAFSNKLLNILMSPAAYCCPQAKAHWLNYCQYNRQLCIGGGLSLRSVRLSQIIFTGNIKTRLLTAVNWPLYLFCSPVGLRLSQLEAVRLTKFGFYFPLFTAGVWEILQLLERDPTQIVQPEELQPLGMVTSWCASYPGLSLGQTLLDFCSKMWTQQMKKLIKNMVWLSGCWSGSKVRCGRGKNSSRTKLPFWSVLKEET